MTYYKNILNKIIKLIVPDTDHLSSRILAETMENFCKQTGLRAADINKMIKCGAFCKTVRKEVPFFSNICYISFYEENAPPVQAAP